VPTPKVWPIPADQQAACKCATKDGDDLVVDKASKGIKWVIVRVLDVKASTPAPSTPVPKLDQRGCKFEPHIMIVAPGTDVEVLNPEKATHNVRVTSMESLQIKTNSTMGPDMLTKTLKGDKIFGDIEVLQINCDMHAWMKAYVVVHDPRFAFITAADGNFEIKDVPPGTYKLSIQHERFGEAGGKEREVVIKAGQTTDLGEIKFKALKPD